MTKSTNPKIKLCIACKRKRRRSKRSLVCSPECHKEIKYVKAWLNSIKKRAKNKGFLFNLQLENLEIPDFCPILGIRLIPGKGHPSDNSPSLDRIDNSKGYLSNNVRIISQRANRLKNNGTADELEKIAKYIRDHDKA